MRAATLREIHRKKIKKRILEILRRTLRVTKDSNQKILLKDLHSQIIIRRKSLSARQKIVLTRIARQNKCLLKKRKVPKKLNDLKKRIRELNARRQKERLEAERPIEERFIGTRKREKGIVK